MKNKKLQKKIFIGCILFSTTAFLKGLSVQDTVINPIEVQAEQEKKITPSVLAGVITDLHPVKEVTEKYIAKTPIKEVKEVQPTRKYYKIPEDLQKSGGNFPEDIQDFLWDICEEKGLDFYIVTAQIEVESGYQSNITGDKGESKGYLQIQEKWHKKRMQAEGVTDLYNPIENIKVGTNCLKELYEKYGEWHKALMCYNMGESKARELWSAGKYSTEYSIKILTRAEEIRQEIEQD